MNASMSLRRASNEGETATSSTLVVMIPRVALVLTVTVTLIACRQPGQLGPPAPERVEGVIVEIDSEGLGEVTSFTLKDGDDTYEIFIAEEVDYGFPLGHLQEHLSSNEPVAVDLEERDDDKLYALTIEDV